MTTFNQDPQRGPVLWHMLKGWDDPRPTAECLHCDGGKDQPSRDGRTECGFCD